MDDFDDLDAERESRRAHLEARFRELEEQAELDELRRRAGMPPGERPARSSPPPQGASQAPSPDETSDPGADPLHELKSRVAGAKAKKAHDPSAPAPEPPASSEHPGSAPRIERFLLVVCPHCEAKNRTRLSRLRTQLPVCGACKRDLAFE
ncbi:MAG: hypothetical protein IT371_03600 [Deltaproteobacteria bacterium]|nr:hypothetical protein [Deltaproteobacteria bacterium]